MFWSRPSRKRIEAARRGLRTKLPSAAARALTDTRALAANAEAKARDLPLAARDKLFARFDDLGDSFSSLSQDVAALAKNEADSVMDGLIEELHFHPLRTLAIAVGLGVTAGLYLRK